MSNLLNGNTQSCGCFSVESSKKNLDKAHTWFKEHPDETKQILENSVQAMLKWQADHPEKAKEQKLKAIKQANSKLESRFLENLNRSSKDEIYLYQYITSLGYNVERQVLVEDHYFDFKINNFLIEYNGSIYHYTDYKNVDNPKSKEPPSGKKDKNFHVNLRNIALRNDYNLIQVWDFDWQNRKEFIKNLIKDQLSGTADYKNYVEKDLLNNDYGFNVTGEQIDPKPVWVSTGYKNRVNEEYTKGKVLVYNSGFTKL